MTRAPRLERAITDVEAFDRPEPPSRWRPVTRLGYLSARRGCFVERAALVFAHYPVGT